MEWCGVGDVTDGLHVNRQINVKCSGHSVKCNGLAPVKKIANVCSVGVANVVVSSLLLGLGYDRGWGGSFVIGSVLLLLRLLLSGFVGCLSLDDHIHHNLHTHTSSSSSLDSIGEVAFRLNVHQPNHNTKTPSYHISQSLTGLRAGAFHHFREHTSLVLQQLQRCAYNN